MAKLSPLYLEDGTVIYIETTDEITTMTDRRELPPEEVRRTSKGFNLPEPSTAIAENFQAIEGTIRAYTIHTLNAFRHLAIANIEEVTLQFGIEVGGEAGIPYITKGTAKSNLNITVKCSFPKPDNPSP
jgi:hypothetical protein